MFERMIVTLVNIFFPPLAVLMVAGVGTDALINCLFFIAGVIPGHIHGFYITCTYFHRKSKVRKGRYPGGKTGMIYSSRVLNGDATSVHVRELWEAEKRQEAERDIKKRSGRTGTARSWGWSGSSRSGGSVEGTMKSQESWKLSEKGGKNQRRRGWWV